MASLLAWRVFFALQDAPSSPIIVKIIEPPDTRLADVLIGALGISGVLALGAIIVGLLVGGMMFWLRSRT
jgi:hypothetical protein